MAYLDTDNKHKQRSSDDILSELQIEYSIIKEQKKYLKNTESTVYE